MLPFPLSVGESFLVSFGMLLLCRIGTYLAEKNLPNKSRVKEQGHLGR